MQRSVKQTALVISNTRHPLSKLSALFEQADIPSMDVAQDLPSARQYLINSHYSLVVCFCHLAASDPVFGICRQLKNDAAIPLSAGLLVISHDANAEMVNAILEVQPDEFLVSPFDNNDGYMRINRLLQRKQALRHVYELIDSGNTYEALKAIEVLLDNRLAPDIYPLALKVKGELLVANSDIKQARMFYESILSLQNFTWAQIGLIACLIEIEEFADAEKQILSLTLRPATAIVAYDLLSLLQVRLQDFDSAFESTSLACELSPGNIDRHYKAVQIARLAKDYANSFSAAKRLIYQAERAHQEGPQHYLICARACIDYAMTADAEQAGQLILQSQALVAQLNEKYPDMVDKQDIAVLSARILYLQDEVSNARGLLKTLDINSWPAQSDETLIDKAKALHEVGLRRYALKLLSFLEHRGKANTDAELLQAYITQQKQDKARITMPARALNSKAVAEFNEHQFAEALVTLQQAYELMPKNPAIALNLLQATLHQLNHNRNASTVSWVSLKKWIAKCQQTIETSTLNPQQEDRYRRIQIAMAAYI